MGYWNATPEGGSLVDDVTGLLWGDEPADIIDGALKEVIEVFERDSGRKPTLAELRAGLEFSAPVVLESTTNTLGG